MTKKDFHPLPRICETLDSLVGAAYFSTFDLTSGFWQVPMAEESKQFTAFTLGSMGLFECDRMPFSLCNAPATFQRLMQNFAHIAAPLYDLISGVNKDKKSELVELSPKALEAFNILKEKCVNAPVLAFPDFKKPFLLETDTSGKGLGAVLSQKQDDGRYHPVTYASRTMNKTEQQYYSNKQEFLALKWAVTEQFHEYLTLYGKNRNEFVVCTDNNPLTYIFSSAHLNAAGHRWVASLANYNFSLEYQKGKDNTVADFLSCMENHLPK